ncbi:MAG: lamin tail domain-containing protein [Patescibacteria group bacterium]
MKKVIVMLMILLFCPSYFAFAALQINEIMYNLKTGSDTGREWIEIFNNSDQEIDMTNIKLFEANTNHKLTLVQGINKIPAEGYAVIVADSAKFKSDWPSYSGTIFDSTFSLSNTGEPLALKEIIKNSENILDQFTYQSSQGGAGDGNSLQKINGAWVASLPTAGVENYLIVKPKITQVATPPAKLSTMTTIQKTEATPLIQPIEKVQTQESNHKISRLLFVTILIILIVIGSIASYFIRRRNRETNSLDTAQDFEILE